MAARTDFEVVRAIGETLPGVEVTKYWGVPALKVGGKMFACMTNHKSAEPNTLAVRMDFAERDALIEEEPSIYYLKPHYVDYPCVLVRLGRVRRDALRGLLLGAYRFVRQQAKRPRRRRTTSGGRTGRT
jgi:hypothetical protein